MYFSHDLFRSYETWIEIMRSACRTQNTHWTQKLTSSISLFSFLSTCSPIDAEFLFISISFFRLSFVVTVDIGKDSLMVSILTESWKNIKNTKNMECVDCRSNIQWWKHKTISDEFILIYVTACLCSTWTHIHIARMEKTWRFFFFFAFGKGLRFA